MVTRIQIVFHPCYPACRPGSKKMVDRLPCLNALGSQTLLRSGKPAAPEHNYTCSGVGRRYVSPGNSW